MKKIRLIIVLVTLLFFVSSATANNETKNKFIFEDSTNIEVTEVFSGYLIQSTGDHLKHQKINIAESDFKLKNKIKDGFIESIYMDDYGFTYKIYVPVKLTGNHYTIDISLSSTCLVH